MRHFVCAVVGGKETNSRWSAALATNAFFVGEEIARLGWAVLTGGLSGVMREAARGAKAAGGVTLGLLPGTEHQAGNEYLDYVLPTSFGIGRNVLTACACDVMVGLAGGSGTLEEMLFAVDFGRPVISFGSFEIEGAWATIDQLNRSGLRQALHTATRHAQRSAGAG